MSIEAAPGAGFTFSRSWGNGRDIHQDGEVEEVEPGRLRLNPHIMPWEYAPTGLPLDVHVVPWGDRVYLIPPEDLLAFANAVNSGSEPRYDSPSRFLIREGGIDIPVTGFPALPESHKRYLLPSPITARVLRTGAQRDGKTEILVDAGRQQGLIEGMELVSQGDLYGTAEITTVRERESVALFGPLPNRPSVLPVGLRLGTRFPEYQHWSSSDDPLRIVVKRFGRNYPKYELELAPLRVDHPEVGAAAQGFKVSLVADIEVSAISGSILSRDKLKVDMERLADGMGANAYHIPLYKSRKVPGPRTQAMTVKAYRVVYGGLPLGRFDFPNELERDKGTLDWRTEGSRMKVNRCRYLRLEAEVHDQTVAELLLISRDQAHRFWELGSAELTAAQRKVFRNFGLAPWEAGTAQETRLPSAALDKWRAVLDGVLKPRIKALRAKEYDAYGEYLRLWGEQNDLRLAREEKNPVGGEVNGVIWGPGMRRR